MTTVTAISVIPSIAALHSLYKITLFTSISLNHLVVTSLIAIIVAAMTSSLFVSVYAQTTTMLPSSSSSLTLSQTYDSQLHGVRVNYPQGWIVFEKLPEENLTASGTAEVPRSVTQEESVLAMCPISQIEENPFYSSMYDMFQRGENDASIMMLTCVATWDGFMVMKQENLNKSESPYLNAKSNLTIDDFFEFTKQELSSSPVIRDPKVINVTDTTINVINSNLTTTPVRQLPAKIVEIFLYDVIQDEYETEYRLLAVDSKTATGYTFYGVKFEDNEIIKTVQDQHRLLQGLEILE